MIRILTIFFLFFGFTFTTFSQTVSINAIDAGPYGRGSSISVPVRLADPEAKFKIDNVFKLYISDASGSFASEKEIGSYKGFFTTFINGILPADLAPGDYKVRVKNSSTLSVSAPSEIFKVNASAGVLADIDAPASQVISNAPKTFGVCKPERSVSFKFTNSSTSGASVIASFRNGLNEGDVKESAFTTPTISFQADPSHYTIFVKAELNGVIGTKGFFLINNIIKSGFSPPANNTVCLPASLEYNIETASSNGIQNNFPGYSYQINWGDNNIENLTPAQILLEGGKVRHTYIQSSCGKQIKINDITYYNVFGIIYQVNSPFCGLVSVPLSTQAKVITQPENRFAIGPSVCINTNVVINNTSITGDNPSSNSAECRNNEIVYYWYVDDVAVTPQGVPITYALNHKFTTPGFHKIRLESESNSNCQAAPLERTVYVQTLPEPDFTLSETLACADATIRATDKSVIDLSEQAKNTYKWTVSGPSNVSFVHGSTSSSKNPEFKFSAEGVYTIRLGITSPCGEIFKEQVVIINKKPGISAEWPGNLCGRGQLLTFDSKAGNLLKTTFTGTAKENADTYIWEISGGAFSFKSNSTSRSKTPTIFFEDYGTYTIRITHKNNCGTELLTKTIRFNESPTISAGADKVICAGNSVTLEGSISGEQAAGYVWIGGNGQFSPSRSSLNPVYIPSQEEILSGQVQLKLSVTTMNPAPCNIVEDLMVIKINPLNKIKSAGTKTICTGNSVNYIPEALFDGSVITWTASGSQNATGYSTSGSGAIKDVLTNSDPVQSAEVRYILTPENNGCKGEPFTLTVTVTAKPTVAAAAETATICSGKEVRINLTSNLSGMRYTWTSTVSGNITGNSKQTTPVALDRMVESLTNAGSTTGFVSYTITPENTSGCAGEPITIKINVSVSPGLTTFSPDKTKGCSPLSVNFKNNTVGSANTYYWDFGDGQKLVTKDNSAVNHVYSSAVSKTFTARLITETDCGKYTSEYTIHISPNTVEPELVVNGNEYEGCAPHTVKFFNNSKGATLFKYDFGDGTIIETNRSPETIVHTFTKGGKYKVTLTASNGCSDTTTSETITVYPQAITDFSADVREGCLSVKVKFSNKSTGALSYLWDFDDGTVSTEANPTHTFGTKKPSYTVRLITTSSFGCKDTLEIEDYIKVQSPPIAEFQVQPGLTIQYPDHHFSFKNSDQGKDTQWRWDFGDGSASSKKDPEHTYTDTGVYKVKLTVINSSGCSDTAIKTVRITGTPGSLFIPNAFMPNSLTEELRTFKAKGSGMQTWQMRIFNKWGELIWNTTLLNERGVPTEGWDGNMFGSPAPQGIYFWEVTAKYKNGTEWAGISYNGSEPKKTGTINLIR